MGGCYSAATMSNRSFTALGTGSQVPTRRRNHNGYFLHWDDRGLMFDPGEGTQRQMAYFGVAAFEFASRDIRQRARHAVEARARPRAAQNRPLQRPGFSPQRFRLKPA